jgi:uncharacterized membrane protein YfcA
MGPRRPHLVPLGFFGALPDAMGGGGWGPLVATNLIVRRTISGRPSAAQALFLVMGTAILLQTLVSVAVAVALWRQRLADRPLGWALRLAMVLTILGALTGPLMTPPTEAQLAHVRATGRMPTVGAHSVGGPDGGPGVR